MGQSHPQRPARGVQVAATQTRAPPMALLGPNQQWGRHQGRGGGGQMGEVPLWFRCREGGDSASPCPAGLGFPGCTGRPCAARVGDTGKRTPSPQWLAREPVPASQKWTSGASVSHWKDRGPFTLAAQGQWHFSVRATGWWPLGKIQPPDGVKWATKWGILSAFREQAVF